MGTASVHHPLFARFYTHVLARNEPAELRAFRDELLAGVSGRVVEVGAGAGANFPHYPSTVTEVVAVEPEAYLREQAQAAAAEAPIRVTVLDGVADALPLEDASCDAAVACLVLCSVPDQATALAELRRVLKPGGELRFLEHVRGSSPRMARCAALRRPHLLAARLRRLPHRPRHGRRDRGGRLRDRAPARPAAEIAAAFVPVYPQALGVARKG